MLMTKLVYCISDQTNICCLCDLDFLNILFASHSPDECNAVCMCDSMHPEEVVVKDFVYALTNLVVFI